MRPKYIEAVNTGDIIDIRLFLTSEMLLDPRGNSFDEMLAYAESHRTDLYVKHDGSVLNEDQSTWDEVLLNIVKNDLDYNFSKERINYYYRMAKVVLAEKAVSLGQETEQSSISHINEGSDYASERRSNNTNIYKGVACGGAALGLVGLILGKTALATTGLAGAVIGSVLLYKGHKK